MGKQNQKFMVVFLNYFQVIVSPILAALLKIILQFFIVKLI